MANSNYWDEVINALTGKKPLAPASNAAPAPAQTQNNWSSANAQWTDAQRAQAVKLAAQAQAGIPANPGVSNTANNGYSRSPDGRITYDQYGRQLDSVGNVAFGTWPSGGGGAAAAPATPAVPASYGLVDPVTGLPLRPLNYATGTGNFNYTPVGATAPVKVPFADASQDPIPWAGLNDSQIQRAIAYYNAQLAQQQAAQNAYQYSNDFTEAKRRYDQEFPWTKKRDAYSVAGAAFLPNARFLAS